MQHKCMQDVPSVSLHVPTAIRAKASPLCECVHTYWAGTVAANVFPPILSLVTAEERGSDPAVLSLILQKLWSVASHRRHRPYHLTGGIVQCLHSGWGGKGWCGAFPQRENSTTSHATSCVFALSVDFIAAKLLQQIYDIGQIYCGQATYSSVQSWFKYDKPKFQNLILKIYIQIQNLL